MRISTDADGIIRVNGLTFLEFMNFFRGKKIINKRGFEVPKYELFWQGAHPEKVKEKFEIVDREK